MKLLDFLKKPFTAKKQQQLSKIQEVEVRKAQQESLDKLNDAFGRLVDKLENINSNLNRHIGQQQELLTRFETIPEITKQQTQLIEQTLEQLSDQANATQQFTEVVSRIPDEALRQTRELEQIKAKTIESADFEKSICSEFVNLNLMMKRQSFVLYILSGISILVAALAIYFIFR